MSERNEHNDGNTQTAYFAGGCFWGLERYFQNVDGVTDTTVGYAQSTVESPAYEQVCAGGTDAAETVKVEFDPAQVSLRTLTLRVKGQNVCLARRVAGVRFGLFECRLSGCSRCR